MEMIQTTPPNLQPEQPGQDVTLKEGEEVNVEVLKKLKANGFLLAVKGKTFSAELDFEPSSQSFRAVVTRAPNGTAQFKFFPPLLEKAATTFTQPNRQDTFVRQSSTTAQDAFQTKPQQTPVQPQTIKPDVLTPSPEIQKAQTQIPVQQTATDARQIGTATVKDIRVMPQKAETAQPAAPSPDPQAVKQAQQMTNAVSVRPAQPVVENNNTTAVKLPPNTLPVVDGEPVEVNIVKMMDNGKTLISVKSTLFEVKLEPQLFKTLFAEAQIQEDSILLTFARMPVENLNPQFVKQQVTGFDLEKFMKAFGKFTHVGMEDLDAQTLKDSLKNSGLTFENKLLNNSAVDGDEKFRALLTGDNAAKDGITKMQITNLVIADGVMSFLKTRDENVGDTLMKMKRGRDGSNTVYVSTNFSELGETLIVIKQVQGTFTVSVKTEKDISEYLNDINVENGTVRWFKFSKQDLKVMNPASELNGDIGKFEVII
ncbi:hypothetical protein [Seleniivibrio woodruffii]|uniref:hypothetical protein n=1 Tax=Seleniivibrio woodruffii TaxID=1078050 RepID=UPI00240A27E0|nr:hypothetical protein [Seleniivibrio woodruffii]